MVDYKPEFTTIEISYQRRNGYSDSEIIEVLNEALMKKCQYEGFVPISEINTIIGGYIYESDCVVITLRCKAVKIPWEWSDEYEHNK